MSIYLATKLAFSYRTTSCRNWRATDRILADGGEAAFFRKGVERVTSLLFVTSRFAEKTNVEARFRASGFRVVPCEGRIPSRVRRMEFIIEYIFDTGVASRAFRENEQLLRANSNLIPALRLILRSVL